MAENSPQEQPLQQQIAALLNTAFGKLQSTADGQVKLDKKVDAILASQEDIKQRLERIETLLKTSVAPTPTPTFEQQLAAAPDAAARLNIACDHFHIERGDFKAMAAGIPEGAPYFNISVPVNGIHRHTIEGYFGTILDALKRYNTQYHLNWQFTPKQLVEVEVKLLQETGILATISYGASGANGPGPWKTSSLPRDIQSQIDKGRSGV